MVSSKCNLQPAVDLIVECFCCQVNLDHMNENTVMFYLLLYVGLGKVTGQDSSLSTAMNGIC